jgi:hypothetical protein
VEGLLRHARPPRQVLIWFKHCKENHALCGQNDEVPLPNRVLCIGDDSEGGVPSLRLHTTKGERGRFVFLSYTWGTTKMPTTTQETLEDRSRGISMQMLPKSWQDAILIVRKMGFRYLWIDALCIIQDSKGRLALRVLQDGPLRLICGNGPRSRVWKWV